MREQIESQCEKWIASLTTETRLQGSRGMNELMDLLRRAFIAGACAGLDAVTKPITDQTDELRRRHEYERRLTR